MQINLNLQIIVKKLKIIKIVKIDIKVDRKIQRKMFKRRSILNHKNHLD